MGKPHCQIVPNIQMMMMFARFSHITCEKIVPTSTEKVSNEMFEAPVFMKLLPFQGQTCSAPRAPGTVCPTFPASAPW